MTGSAYYIRFEELQNVIGREAAINLVALHGGRRIYVRQVLPDDSFIIAAIGRKAGDELAAHIATGIGGMCVEIPTNGAACLKDYKERLRILASDRTMSETAIADELRISTRTVRRMRARIKNERGAKAVTSLDRPL